MRINGFSGMDIDSMVTSLMTAKRAPLDKLNQQKTRLEWTRDSYREMNSKMVDFKSKLTAYKHSGAMNTQQVTVTGNTTAVKAEVTGNANGTPMSVEVTKIAEKAYLQSASGLKTPGSVTSDVTLKTTLMDIGAGSADDTYDLYINKTKLTFKATDTVSSVISKISSSSGSKVNASFDELSGKFSITAKDYGTISNIQLTDTDGTAKASSLLTLLGFPTDVIAEPAKIAEVTVTNTKDGTSKVFYPDNNSLIVNGVQLTILDVTGTDGPSSITTRADPTKALETIKAFVENYNDLISTFNKKTSEEKYRTFVPLSDKQKADMKESEITAWEAKAKSGLLKNDGILNTAISDMRSIISGQLSNLSSVGITTGQYFENGKIYIDEKKLTASLESDPEKIMNIFKGITGDSVNTGIYNKLDNVMNKALDNLVKSAGTSKYSNDANSIFKEESVMGRQLKGYNKRISALATRLADMETRYYKQFTAMEKSMGKYNSQSSSLTSLLG
ncbi:flagellar filament capping protein FliD [Paenibacillus sp. IHBB 10380]|uniref:flagellar filament capping protein FliD n=1 Tax=Paenibacillus sp. IHBB 10380 TaxID=1566358 RepID=UPI0005CFB5AD|nr:flagellar filament capping protein FliD [Paenibacillus sp. IHBB 10380]AJS60364.1 flagellar capping protein [Paenibacillus sp. IHBB 10380]